MKYAIKPIEIAPKVWLGVDEEGEWHLFYASRKPEDEWHVSSGQQYLLDFAVLVLRSAETIEIALVNRLCGMARGVEEFNDRAVQKLIGRANKLWTFEVPR